MWWLKSKFGQCLGIWGIQPRASLGHVLKPKSAASHLVRDGEVVTFLRLAILSGSESRLVSSFIYVSSQKGQGRSYRNVLWFIINIEWKIFRSIIFFIEFSTNNICYSSHEGKQTRTQVLPPPLGINSSREKQSK